MQTSFRDRERDLGFLRPKSSPEDLSDSEPMVLGMSGESYQANGHDSYELSAREGSSSIGVSKKTLPANGKKTKGRVKIKMEFIDNKLRRYTTFSKRKTGIMKKAYELSTLTGTQVMLLVASETGHVYTFATRKLQPMITSEAGKALIQTCLNSPDPPPGPGASGLDQRMSATGFEETDLTYSVADDCEKMSDSPGNTVYSPEVCPTSITSGTTLLSFTSSLPTSSNSQRDSGSKSTFTSSSSAVSTSHITTANSSHPSAGFATILTASASGGTKNQSVTTSSNSSSSSHNSISVVPGSSQNLSVVSGNVVIPQTILQANNSALLYHTGQGLVYATPSNLPEGVVLNLGQEQGGNQQQFITIPVSLSLTPAQQQQLMQGTSNQNSSLSSSSHSRREKNRK